MNCCVAPVAKVGMLGVTAMEVTVLVVEVTVRAADPEIPFRVAEMEADPAVTPVARPEALTVATALLEEVQVALVRG